MDELSWKKIEDDWNPCAKCKIAEFAMQKVFLDVIPIGRKTLDVLFIGEGPGKSEDALGKPFLGVAGQILRNALGDVATEGGQEEIVVGFANLVLCRPTDSRGGNNRPPDAQEVENCSPRLKEMIQYLTPRVIVCLGRVPQNYVPPILAEIRYSCTLVYLAHPSYVARMGGKGWHKYVAYESDIQEAVRTARKLKAK